MATLLLWTIRANVTKRTGTGSKTEQQTQTVTHKVTAANQAAAETVVKTKYSGFEVHFMDVSGGVETVES